jgi:hypothetical protein
MPSRDRGSKVEELPEAGELLYDEDDHPCIVVKTWPYEDRVYALRDGEIDLISLSRLKKVIEIDEQAKHS